MIDEPEGILPGLEGLDVASSDPGREPGAVELAAELPVARVAIDTRVPHLDRLFDYSVPAHLDHDAQPGVRVRVSFHGRETVAWLIERVATSDASVSLQALRDVVSPVRALRPEIWELCRSVAARSAGLVSDVVRLAVPPRAARAERQFEREVLGLGQQSRSQGASEGKAQSSGAEPEKSPAKGSWGDGLGSAVETHSPTWLKPEPDDDVSGWALYRGGESFLDSLATSSGPPVRGVMSVAPSAESGWAQLAARACAETLSSGRRALVIVPDRRSLDQLESAVNRLVDGQRIARLHHEDGLSARYSSFLRVLSGEAWVVIGTRSAAFAPVPELGVVVCYDDGDENLTERQAPYCHARDVLLLRAQLEKCSSVFLGYAVSPECQRLVQTGWARSMAPAREDLRKNSPLIRATSDSYTRERDPLAARARIPHLAYQVAREGLNRGPVLIQVARTGYAPSLACSRCRESARCQHCYGPLSLEKDSRSHAVCRWCHRGVAHWQCTHCGHDSWRLTSVGALRTAEELGRAFPQVPVVSSSGENIKASIGDSPALVVATPGAEPTVPGGYTAALLLDGDLMLSRDSLRNAESVLRRWMNASALVASRDQGGQVVCTAEDSAALGALIRWDPSGFASRELAERHELLLPPAVRTVAITGPRVSVEEFVRVLHLDDLEPASGLRVIDPVPLTDDETDDDYRAIIFMSYGLAPQVTERLRSTRASFSASKKYQSVQIRCDALDVL
ncbi:primosomal protein N' [Kocuria massiliensis]|uniref:primosomal protein N' n=1 Tax=Kocuria massiliensis TaxID=1926282 RepID=UPI000A1CC368|nr:primosomal protein N' [Kocuria massiliensis]